MHNACMTIFWNKLGSVTYVDRLYPDKYRIRSIPDDIVIINYSWLSIKLSYDFGIFSVTYYALQLSYYKQLDALRRQLLLFVKFGKFLIVTSTD
jgi:hypothetical protein